VSVSAAKAKLGWAVLHVLTRRRFDALKGAYGDLSEAWTEFSPGMLRELGVKEEAIPEKITHQQTLDLEALERQLQEQEIVVLSMGDAGFPPSLLEIHDPPVLLFAKGDLAVLRHPCVSLVGTRAMSGYGRRIVEHLVPSLVASGVTTVSGLAHGVDSEVAMVTLASGGRTVAVLGHGLSVYTPREKALMDRIVGKGGLLLTEYPLDYAPSRFTFPERNRIIAGLSLGTVIVEAAESSGALITASLALEMGREVFAVPGAIFDGNFKGCHNLIARGGAKLIVSAEEILEDLGMRVGVGGEANAFQPRSKEEEIVYGALTAMPQALDDLVETLNVPTSKVSSTLTVLELRGVVKNVGAGQWVRV
jgi:DNA processing protein